jgi:hypothetical protein
VKLFIGRPPASLGGHRLDQVSTNTLETPAPKIPPLLRRSLEENDFRVAGGGETTQPPLLARGASMDSAVQAGWYVLGPSQEHVGPYTLAELRGISSPFFPPNLSRCID